MYDEYKSDDDVQEPSLSDKFSKLFDQLEHCNEDEQRKKIEEMDEIVDEMKKEEFESILKTELFNKMDKMIKERTLSWGNTILLLKHIGYYKVLKKIFLYSFDYSLLSKRMKEMMIDENEKKKERNEKILTDICECYALLIEVSIPKKLYSIIVPCLLKVALKKDETDEAQKEVEMALLALGNIGNLEMKRELYLNEIADIIQYHQQHQNLTRLAYQSAWQFLIKRFYNDESLEEVIVNELHFAREARRELEELMRCIDWKRKEEEREKETEDELVLKRWLKMSENCFHNCKSWNEECSELIRSICQVYRASRDNYFGIQLQCLNLLEAAAENKDVKTDNFLKSGAIGIYLEEMKQSTLVNISIVE
eukprot:MONOS_14291.1-p1 / transcript=MONOS_14291.1 / gene=MONOS_14291 / organism=Monocercomonoides_exilis_PA203 / gene_product=unspecified product / transcript_product=unspecified product / location=Mono_scaffold00973:462-1681(-) / protein_length=365 / sequence_SO=supercontig / SO=protein_coding / is_pseudo=false